MVNRWTGSFDAAIEIAPSGANAVLAAVHRKGDPVPGAPPSGPHMLHSLALNLPLAGSQASHGVRGHLQVQLSTPTLSVPQSSGPLQVSFGVYAWFQEAIGSAPAPAFVHGTLTLETGVELVECSGSTLAEIRIAADDAEVRFTPHSGAQLSAAQVSLVESVIEDTLSEALRPVQLRIAGLGTGELSVERLAFRGLKDGAQSALALFLGFESGAGAPSTASDVFLQAGEDAGVALGREFLTEKLRSVAQAPLAGISVSGSKWGVGFSAAPDPSTLAFELRAGRMHVQVDGSGSLSPGGSFQFRLSQDFGVAVSGGVLTLTLIGGPQLDITQGNTFLKVVFGLFKGRILDQIEVAAAGIVQLASAELDRIVSRSVGDLLERIEVPGLSLRFERAAIDPDAVVIGGALDIGPTRPVVASFTDVIHHPAGAPIAIIGPEFDALESWIPGGTIESYHWVELRGGGTIGRSFDEEHRFVLRVPPVATSISASHGWPPVSWCLQVNGTQYLEARDPVPVSGAVCGVSSVVPGLDLPALPGRLTVHVADGQGGVRADYDPWSQYRPHALDQRKENRGYLLVHRADGEDVGAAVEVLRAVLAKTGAELALFPTLVVGGETAYACGVPNRELDEFALTNDPEGAWRARFGLERSGTTVIVGAGGAELWRDVGQLQAEVLRKVLEGLPREGARPPRRRAVSLSLPLGVFAPNVFFPCEGAEMLMALSKVRGREVELCFWTSWSGASIEELRRRVAANEKDPCAPLCLCVNDGEDPKLAAEALRTAGLELPLVSDPDRRISRAYGVSCWPTVVHVDRGGRIAGVRFGLDPTHS